MKESVRTSELIK